MPKKCINRVTLLGNLARDAESKQLPGGSTVTNFTVATSRSYKQGDTWKEESTFTKCVGFRLENVVNYLQKGKQVLVEGRIQTRSWDNKEGVKQYATEVVVDDVILLGGGEQRPARDHSLADNNLGITDSDVPF